MELLNLVAKMTLDASDYETKIAELLASPQPIQDIKVIPIMDEDGLKSFAESVNKKDDLKVTPTVDTTEYEKGLKEAEEETNWFREVMKGAWQGIKDAIVVTGITGVLSGIVSYLRQGINLAIKDGKAIEAGAKNLQLSIRAYQEWDYVLGKSNMGVKDLTKAMTEMDSIRAGTASEEKIKYLQKLGISAEDATSGMMSAETLLNSVMKGLADYQGTDKGAIIDAFFGKSANWTGYFSQTSAEIEGLKQEAESLGVIMSDESVKNAKEFQDASERLNDRLEAIKRSFGEGIIPLITEAVNKLMMIVDFFNGQDKRTSSEKFVDLEDKFQAQLNDIKATGITAKTLAQTLINMGDTSTMDSTQLAIWRGTAESLINLIPTLSGVIDTENGTISESSEGIERLIDQYTELSKATAYQTSKAERQAVIDQKENKLVEEATKANEKLAEAEGNRNKAIDDFNKVVKKYEGENANLLGYDATLEDIQRKQISIIGAAGENSYAASELAEAASPLTQAINAANAAQAEVDKLTADIEQGKTELADWIDEQGATYEAISGTAEQAVSDVEGVNGALADLPSDVYTTIHISTDGETPEGFAKGSWNVPYDMPAYLHSGEMVLTKSQARKYRDGEGGNGVDYEYIGTLIGSSVKNAMSSIFVTLDGDKVGDFTTRRTDRNIRKRETAVLRGLGG